ncbi:hypothetical protein ACWGMA_28890 [Streptomyces asiaticus]
MNAHKSIALAAAATALAGGLALAAPAHAVSTGRPAAAASAQHGVHIDGYEPDSVVTRGACKGWMNTKKTDGHWFAQGLVQSWNGTRCAMILEREHNGGAYNMISDQHIVPDNGTDKDSTGYYWDHTGYKSRVCIANLSWGDASWHCGKGI